VSKGRNNVHYRHGGLAGWTEYRYGDPKAKPITLAGKKPKQIFKGKDRDRLVDKVMDALRDWRQSPFENEGPVRAGLRSALCMKGHGWHPSDHEASEIVRESLRRIGAVRPTWEQGQRYYADPRENCRWCFGSIAEEDMSGNRNRLFCSDHCRRAAYVHWNMKNASKGNAMEREAYRAIYSERLPDRQCESCHKAFKPNSAQRSTRFCSLRCAQAERRLEIPERPCEQCQKMFRPPSGNLAAKFCGRKCADKAKRIYQPRRCQMCATTFIPRREENYFCSDPCARRARSFREVECQCQYCRETFIAKRPDAIYCSTACMRSAYRIDTGRVKKLSRPVFDYLFTRHRRSASRRDMTTAMFDRLFREAA
jgi:hypothetical protein